MNNETSLLGAATLRPIDIEKLAEEHLTPFARTGWTAYGEQLTKFAEALLEEQDELVKKQEREIAEFKSQINELKSLLIDARDDVAAQLDAYQELLPYKQHRYDAQKNTLDEIDKALSKTPAQSLQEFENEVIERCAKVCESLKEVDEFSGKEDITHANTYLDYGAEAIRAMKGNND